jgi:hypothetical protein
MQKVFLTKMLYVIIFHSFGQNQKKAVTYLNAKYNKTILKPFTPC